MITPTTNIGVLGCTWMSGCPDADRAGVMAPFSPAHEVQGDAGDAEGAQQAERVQVAENRGAATGGEDDGDGNRGGQEDGPVRCVAQAVAPLQELGEEARTRESARNTW